MALTKEQILQADDRPTETVNVPEWGGEVIIKTMSGAERSGYDEGNRQIRGDSYVLDLKNLPAKLLSRCLVGDDGEPLFTIAELNQKSSKVLNRLFEVATKMNGLSPDSADEAGKDSTSESDSSTSE
jgi:hypothetical protein